MSQVFSTLSKSTLLGVLVALHLGSCSRESASPGSSLAENQISGGGGDRTDADPEIHVAEPEVEPALVFDPTSLDFGGVRLGGKSSPQTFLVTNTTAAPIDVEALFALGEARDEFHVTRVGFRDVRPVGLEGSATPDALVLQPGVPERLQVVFEPDSRGMRAASARVQALQPAPVARNVSLRGVGMGLRGDEHRINAAGEVFFDGSSKEWSQDFGSTGGSSKVSSLEIGGTSDDGLYQTQRTGTNFAYAIPLPISGRYEVTLHLAELSIAIDNGRVFDVLLEGEVRFDDVDIHAQAGLRNALTLSAEVTVTDGMLDVEFQSLFSDASVAAIEVKGVPYLVPQPPNVDFGAVAAGMSANLGFSLKNEGLLPLSIDTVELMLGGSGTGDTMTLDLGGNLFVGGSGDVSYATDLEIGSNQTLSGTLTFAPQTERYDSVDLRFSGPFGSIDVPITGLGGHEGDPYLHVVIQTDAYAVDYDADGSESVVLDGSTSHTHEPGRAIIDYTWTDGGMALSTDPVAIVPLSLGAHDIELAIGDDNLPQRTLDDSVVFDVLASSAVPRVLVRYYESAPGAASTLLDAVPSTADFVELIENFRVDGTVSVGGSPFVGDVMVQLEADLDLPTGGSYVFTSSGGDGVRLEVDDVALVNPIMLTAGSHKLEARFALDDTTVLPIQVTLALDGGSPSLPDPSILTHDESTLVPVINTMPSAGSDAGGNRIELLGLGFFPDAQVTVHWGGTDLTDVDFLVLEPDRIEFLSPPGSGQISVTVETPVGTSNSMDFAYSPGGPVPINFINKPEITVPSPSTAVWGPDGRFYVLGLSGQIIAIDFNDDYTVASQTTYPGVSGLSNSDSTGITINPYDPPSPVKLYVAHGKHFVNGGSSFSGPSPYTGQVSTLEGPNFDTPVPLITGLPTSNHDHAVNGLVFDNNGDLLMICGSNTNAGVKHPVSGDLPESPLSSAVLRARTSKGGAFNGVVTYSETATGLPNDDQVDGESVDVDAGVDVEVFAGGTRNPYDMVYTTTRRLYATDNGPNFGAGAASTGATTEDPSPYDGDEVNLIELGNYYGHPNRNRGRYDPRENVYRNRIAPHIPGEFSQLVASVNSSANGIDEYRADTFQGQLRGDLIVQKWGSQLRRVELKASQRHAEPVTLIYPWTGALSVRSGPGGALLAIKYSSGATGSILVLEPDDASAVGLVVHDIFPWRAPATGGTPFVIGGVGFGTLGNTSVTIDGLSASLTSVSATRIEGTIPVHGSPLQELVDVVVTVGTESDTLEDAFHYLPGQGQSLGIWRSLASVPVPLGEVTAAQYNGILYLTGEGSTQTYAYDLINRQWLANRAQRFYAGHHISAEVVGNKIYFIGGLGNNSEGKVQIYDPVANSWSMGMDMPWAAGSVSTCAIGGKIYAAGGIVGGSTVNNCAVYDPVLNTWTSLAPMPAGRNHAAAGTDGERFFIFGGRVFGNFVTNGFDDTQIYDPVGDTWVTSASAGPPVQPLPQARGGMGKAVYWQGEFYVIGGETDTGPGANMDGVYDRVDVYDPVADTWRLDKPMPNPRHGVFPVLFQGIIFLPGGGDEAGGSTSNTFDLLHRQ